MFRVVGFRLLGFRVQGFRVQGLVCRIDPRELRVSSGFQSSKLANFELRIS